MNLKKERRYMMKLLAGITAVAVFSSSLYLPRNVETVYANETVKVSAEPEVRSVNLNIDGKIAGLEDPTVPESTEAKWSNGTGTYIYYAGIGRSKLLDADTTDFSKDGEHSLFAVSDGQVDRDILYRDEKADNGQKYANDWKYSDMYLYLTGETGVESPNTYYPNNIAGRLFNKVQMAALINNYNDSHKDWEETSGELAYARLDGEKLFLLDAREIEHEGYGFSHTHEGSRSQLFENGGALLRSPSISNDMKAGITMPDSLDCMKYDVTAWNVADNIGVVYPAYNIRLSSVFYTAYREEDQFLSANLDPDESYRMTKEKGGSNAWTVSVFDGNDGFRARRIDDDGILKPGGGIYFTIDSMGKSGEDVEYDRISAMLVDEKGTVIAYGKICDLPRSGSSLMVKIPEEVEDGKYTIKIFAEEMLYEPEWHGYFYTPAGSIASYPTDIEIEVDKRSKPSVMFHTYTPSVIYSGNRLSVPGKYQMGIMGAEYEDVEFNWYKDRVSEENRLEEAPKDIGTYYLEACIPETETRQSASAVNGPTVITPKTVTPYITGSISKTYDGSDGIDGADSSLSIRLEGTAEGDDVTACSGRLHYADSEIGTEKTIVAEDIEIVGADKDNYILSSDTAVADIGIIGKLAYPLNIPQNQIEAANTVRTVSDSLILPDGWEWEDNAGDITIPSGGSVSAMAVYTAGDSAYYETTSVEITITRAACEESEVIADAEPNCLEKGNGHTICLLCGDIIRENVEIDALGHDWDNTVTVDKQPTCTEAGNQSIHCKRCDATKHVTEIDATGHSWDEGTVTHEATCQEDGETLFVCDNCGVRKTETVAKINHVSGNPVSENSVSANCTEVGFYDEVVYCESCNQEISRKKITVDALGHNLSKVNEKAATVKETGCKEHWVCERCGRLFLDENASVETNREEIIIPTVTEQQIPGKEDDDITPSPSQPGNNPETPTSEPTDHPVTPTPAPSDSDGNEPTPSPSPDKPTEDNQNTNTENVKENPVKEQEQETEKAEDESAVQPEKGEQVKDAVSGAVYQVLSASGKTVAYKQPINTKQRIVTIPSTITIEGRKYKVVSVAAGAFKENKTVTRVKMGGSIKEIGKNAFYGCSSLKTVTIGKNVTSIGEKSFYKCTSLTKVTIPAKVSKMGKAVFYGCKKLKLIQIKTKKLTDKTIGAKAFKGIYKNAVIKVPISKRNAYKKMFKKKGVTGKMQVIK